MVIVGDYRLRKKSVFGARFGGEIVGKGTGGFKRGLIGSGLQFLASSVGGVIDYGGPLTDNGRRRSSGVLNLTEMRNIVQAKVIENDTGGLESWS